MDLLPPSLYVQTIWFVQRNLLETFIPAQGELRKLKNPAIRTFVVALAVAGFSASSMYSASTSRTNEAKVIVANPGVVSSPSPMCTPGHTSCGIE